MAYKSRADQLAAGRAHYQKYKQHYIDKAARRKREIKQEIRALKQSTPCSDCKVSYPYYVMDFDHREHEIKMFEIARLLNEGGIHRLKREIAKCDLVCSNCHRERTFSRLSKNLSGTLNASRVTKKTS